MPHYSTIIGRRTVKPILWNLVLQTCFLSCFLFVYNINILNPIIWFYDWYVSFLWQGSWMYMLPLAVAVILLASANTEDYVKIQPFYRNRISLLRQAFTTHNVGIGFLHVCIGFLISWAYSSLISGHYERFWYTCSVNPEETCLSEKRLFLIEGAVWVSFLHFIHCHFFGTRYLKFPIAQLPKIMLIKGQFLDTLKDSIKWVIIPDISFLIIYYLRVGSLNSSLAYLFGCQIEKERIDTLPGLFDLALLRYFVVFSYLITASIRFMEMFSRVYLTERFKFPFYNMMETSDPTLPEGLKMSQYPLVQHLAFLDLMLLCSHSKSRREDIFKLSSFGGHPHLWNAVKEGCFDIINEFIESLDESLSSPTHLISPGLNTTPTLRRNVPYYFTGYLNKKENVKHLSPNRQRPPGAVSSLVERIKNSQILVFIFGSRKDMKIRHTLRLSLPVSWACESLSHLSSFSFKEDKFGILVGDLPEVIDLLLQLKNSLDTLLKRTAFATTFSRQDVLNIAEATALKKSVKRSIYRIVNTFKNYIGDLQLSKDIENQLMPYIMYRE